jgi:hypothetical protein
MDKLLVEIRAHLSTKTSVLNGGQIGQSVTAHCCTEYVRGVHVTVFLCGYRPQI